MQASLFSEEEHNQCVAIQHQFHVEYGQLWELGNHRLLCGDSTQQNDVERLLCGITPNLMVTDPPYGVSYNPTWRDDVSGKFGDGNAIMRGIVNNDDQSDWSMAYQLFTGDVAYVWCASLHVDVVFDSLRTCGFDIRSVIVWNKHHFSLMRYGYHWKHELCVYAVRSKKTAHWIGDRKQTTVWNINSLNALGGAKQVFNHKSGHGTQKPVECMEKPITNHESRYVYDPFVGCGTTIVACERLKRVCLAIEINPDYVALCLERYQRLFHKTPRLLQ